MTDLPSLIAALDVTVVDPDLLWRVAHMNLLRAVIVRDFAAPDEALEALTLGRPAVIVVGPASPAEHVEQIVAARRAHPELRILRCTEPAVPRVEGVTGDEVDGETVPLDTTPVETSPRAFEPGFDAAVVDDGDEERFRDAVMSLLVAARSVADVDVLVVPAGDVASAEEAPAGPGAREGEATGDDEVDASATVAPSHPAPHHLRPGPGLRLPPRLAVITAAKGGEGASTVALNLAHELVSRAGVRTAIVDGELFFGDVVMDMGVVPSKAPVVRDLPLTEDVLEGLFTWPVGHEPIMVRSPIPDGALHAKQPELLRELLSTAGENADVVVADVPLELLLAAPWIDQVAIVVLVTSARTASVKNALVAAQRLSGLANIGLVVNDMGHHPRHASPEEMAETVGLPLLGHLPDSGPLRRSGAKPRPRAIAEPHTHYAHAMTAVRRAVASHFPVLV